MYEQALQRNLGWITGWEQQVLRGKRVAIAGLGGVGGAHLLTLVRLGIGAFHVADFDRFELPNFNRQIGAGVQTLGRDKTGVLADLAREINPELDLRIFPEGVTERNLDSFLAGVDLFVDGFDAFVLEMRARVFARCAALGIPSVTAGPIGMGAAYLIFMPGKMGFEEYFRLAGVTAEQQYVRWFLGLAPKGLHRRYLVESARLDVLNRRGPSLGAACMLCAGVTGIEVLKLLLGRGKVYPAPYYHQFDVYRERFVRGRLRGGNGHPLQRVKIALGCRLVRQLARDARPEEPPPPATALERILEAARWTPSGDNSQPWRLHVTAADRVGIEVICDPEQDIMNIGPGQPALLSAGMMLEALALAATAEGKAMRWEYRSGEADTGMAHRLEVTFPDEAGVAADPLVPYIRLRHTDRRCYRRVALSRPQQKALEAALGDRLTVRWCIGIRSRWAMAALNMRAFALRLRSRKACAALAGQMEWDRPFAEDKIPALTLPATRLSRRIMRWALSDGNRVAALTRIPGALLPAAVELEWLPALRCAGHVVIVRNGPLPQSQQEAVLALLKEGRALMRFWLTLTKLGLSMQPNYTPIVFGHYGKNPDQLPPPERSRLEQRCRQAAFKLEQATGEAPERVAFMGRIGVPYTTAIAARAVRKPLASLIVGTVTGPEPGRPDR